VVSRSDFAEAARSAEALARRTSLGVGGRPDYLFEPRTEEEAAEVVVRCRELGIPLRYLGGGFNLLVRDSRVEGAVLATRRLKYLHVHEDSVAVGAGNSFPSLVTRAIALGIPGLPGCPGIPGSVGGVVFMNAGGRFGSVEDALAEVTFLDAEGNRCRRFVHPGDMGYRTTVFGGCLVTGAVFRRDPTLSEADLRALHEEALAWKKATQPLSAKSAGCIFKNPDGPEGRVSAGALIERAGLKGRAVGDARISTVHANFIENAHRASAEDIHALIRLVQREVAEKFGVSLEPEVHIW
jgi:UDP-N-acetylmuramate dehydrogenase